MLNSRPPFTTWLNRQRRALDLTQQEIACRVGCALTTLQKLENGERRPSKQIAGRFAAVLGVPAALQAASIAYARVAFRKAAEAARLQERALSLDQAIAEALGEETACN